MMISLCYNIRTRKYIGADILSTTFLCCILFDSSLLSPQLLSSCVVFTLILITICSLFWVSMSGRNCYNGVQLWQRIITYLVGWLITKTLCSFPPATLLCLWSPPLLSSCIKHQLHITVSYFLTMKVILSSIWWNRKYNFEVIVCRPCTGITAME